MTRHILTLFRPLESVDELTDPDDDTDPVAEAVAVWADHLWTWALLPVVLGVGLYLTVRSGVIQFR